MPKNEKPHSYKHKTATRAHIPSREEAGTESENPKVAEGPRHKEFPKNPVVERGQDPELFWLNKYGANDLEDKLKIDIRSLYRSEHIAPEQIIQGLFKIVESDKEQPGLFGIADLFGNTLEADELEKPLTYYKQANWTNRMVQGDALLTMLSMAEREGLAGQVQTIFFDPPYGIKYGGNWQIRLNDKSVQDGKDEHLTGEGEQIKAFRDTWELGIHSYLSYLRDRLLVAKELLNETGSIFVQIGNENVHLVRTLLDEVFGSENFINLIAFTKTQPLGSTYLPVTADYLVWYGKNKSVTKYRQLFLKKEVGKDTGYKFVELPDGSRRNLTPEESQDPSLLPEGSDYFTLGNLASTGITASCLYDFTLDGRKFSPRGKSWKTHQKGMMNLIKKHRVHIAGNTPMYVQKFSDFPVKTLGSYWEDTRGEMGMRYVVQTSTEVVKRCILMTTDPGDLVLDPTSGSGTTAYVCEQWGRRWIAIDTSRIATNIAKTRLMTAVFPHYKLADEVAEDIRQGFLYKQVPHVTLKSVANDEPPETETLYDQPFVDTKRLRVAGPFTVETLQEQEPMSPLQLATLDDGTNAEENQRFEERIFVHLQSAGIKTGDKKENAVFTHVEALTSPALHAYGFYKDENERECKAYIHIGPKYGTVSRLAINTAVKECRALGDADWLVILGFSFESTEIKSSESSKVGEFTVTRVRMADDLMQEGLIKKDKKAASFVTIGEPDIKLHRKGDQVTLEILGVDIYDPISDQVKTREVADIAYWMLDPDYDGANFYPRQVYFCGGEKDEYDDWKKGLNRLAIEGTKKKAQKTLRIEIDDEAFENLYGHESRPVEVKKGQKIAVRVISQFGEETTRVLTF
jgi:adenine-specific DNA-methyltransferase